MADEKLIPIKFHRRTPVGNTTYNAGEIAAFPRHIADAIRRGGAGEVWQNTPSTPLIEKKSAQ